MSEYTIKLTNDELRILCNCLLNIDNELDDNEFNALIGAEREEVRELFEKLRALHKPEES
ncbi:MAG: hypothetical protein H6799_00925 [Candidatus Nomurabacteria bacterium]|nr:MAG: hypothetical protein H6799_00925 [Candidatus Nomurabacteria bacterium]